ncbi:MAG TPA: ESX secretion-associated protein EspG [Actinophytocola sp.]|uniref:ESX secretion-associated protein EspG n=1 Tax=Actinophytocola sp. TaxID=1872138 RepID=UPI002DBD5E5A|nr:ESX secretion-associated protein EspG [Actinophytocola sp.]HEU5472187.1 ESX secretion-associated protein EspG [Actinophytocola sp.]
MVLPKRLTLPAETLARMVALESLGELHITLKPPAMWRPRHLEDEEEARARAEFRRLGLFDRRGRLDVELVASLAVLCRPGVEFYGWISRDETTIGVLAAAIGREAVLAVRTGDQVTLSQIRPETLPESLVGQSADIPPGRGDAFSMLQSEALASAGGHRRTEAGVGTRMASAEVRLAQKIAEQPTTGGGQLSVAVRDGIGRRKASPHPLRFADTPNGRWLNQTTPVGNGDNRIFIAPASHRDLVHRLQEMHRAL